MRKIRIRTVYFTVLLAAILFRSGALFEFFQRLGFAVTDRHQFPEKIWSDCAQCPKHTCCDEIAMIFEVQP